MDATMFASDDSNPDPNSYNVLSNITSINNYNNRFNENSSSDEDVYDYTDVDTSLPLDELLPVSLVYGLTLVVGVVGNLLVIVAVARDRRLRSITNIFLTSLASADLALLCFCVPVKCVAFFSYTWAFGFFLCKSVNYCQNLSMVCSVMTLTMMSIERNIAIRSPLQSKRICTRSRAKLVVLLLWSGSVLLALPILVGQKHKAVGLTHKHYWCIREWDRPVYGMLFESYMLILLFLVPVGVMIVSYTTICLELAKGTKFRRQATTTSSTTAYRSNSTNCGRLGSRRGQLTQEGSCREDMLQTRNRERMEKEKIKVIRMLIVVVVLFAVCWGPILFNNLLVSVGVLDNLHTGPLKPLRQTMFLMSYLNSSLNPLVYGFMSRHFRRGFREAICVCCSSNRRRGGEGMIRNGSRKSNTTCYYPSESHTSTERTGTIRLSPVTETRSADYCEVEEEEEEEEEDIDDTDDESSRHGRKVWARTENVTLGLNGCKYVT